MNPRLAICVALGMVLGCAGCRKDAAPPTETREPAREQSPAPTYFPLAVGNSWTFRCSSEGRFQFEKTVRITADTSADSIRFFRAEMTPPAGDAPPLVYYLFSSPDTTVSKTNAPARDSAEPLVRSNISRGERVGKLVVAGIEKANAPATGDIEVLRLESFSAEDPTLTEAQRIEWQGRSYAKGVGPVIEADGLGNECVLSKYHVQP
jgi:hypothetical protein